MCLAWTMVGILAKQHDLGSLERRLAKSVEDILFGRIDNSVLTLVDESDLLIKGSRRTIGHQDLERFNQAQGTLLSRTASPNLA